LESNIDLIYYDKINNVKEGSIEKLFNVNDLAQLINNNVQRDSRNKVVKNSFLLSNSNPKRKFTIEGSIEKNKMDQEMLGTRQVWGNNNEELSFLKRNIIEEKDQQKQGFAAKYYIHDDLFDYKLMLRYAIHGAKENTSLLQENVFASIDTSNYTFTKLNTIKSIKQEATLDINVSSFLLGLGLLKLGRFNLESKLIMDDGSDIQGYNFKNNYNDDIMLRNDFLSFSDKSKNNGIINSFIYHKLMTKNVPRGSITYGIHANITLQNDRVSNNSTNTYRTYYDKYNNILPSFRFYYKKNNKISSNTNAFQLEYSKKLKNPQIYQKIALIDSSQRDFNYIGNMNLSSETADNFEAKFSNSKISNNSTFNMLLRYAIKHSPIIDSTLINDVGERILYNINGPGEKNLYLNADYRSSFMLFFPITMMSYLNSSLRKSNYYTNDVLFHLNQKNVSTYVSFRLKPSKIIDVKLSGNIDYYHNTSYREERTFKSKLLYSNFSLESGIEPIKGVSFVASYSVVNSNTYTLSNNTVNLLNIHLAYRTLKKENLELKLSCYDLFKQWQSFKNYSYNNVIGQSYNNNLQQYFLLSLSYYLRHL